MKIQSKQLEALYWIWCDSYILHKDYIVVLIVVADKNVSVRMEKEQKIEYSMSDNVKDKGFSVSEPGFLGA